MRGKRPAVDGRGCSRPHENRCGFVNGAKSLSVGSALSVRPLKLGRSVLPGQPC